MHLKRQDTPKSWPIERKGTKYIVKPSHNKKNALPLLIVLRDMLKIARNRKEARQILSQGTVLINNIPIKNEDFSVLPFDSIKIGNKNYKLGFSEKGDFALKEGEKEIILKVVGKKILKGGKMQLNLLYGKNIISEKKVSTGCSIAIKENKIVEILPLEKGREVIVFSGKYKGKEGKIEGLDKKIANISCKGKKINAPLKMVMVIK